MEYEKWKRQFRQIIQQIGKPTAIYNEPANAFVADFIGESNIPSLLPMNASDLYAKNIQTLLLHLADKDAFKWEMEEDITKGSLIVHQGKAVHPSVLNN